jgi:hypothetical protein
MFCRVFLILEAPVVLRWYFKLLQTEGQGGLPRRCGGAFEYLLTAPAAIMGPGPLDVDRTTAYK